MGRMVRKIRGAIYGVKVLANDVQSGPVARSDDVPT